MGRSMEKDKGRVGHFLMGVVVLTWGINFGVAKSAFQDIPPVLFAAIRFTISGLLIFLLTFWRERSVSIRKEDLGMVAAVGGLGLGLYQILWSLGLNMTSASNSALILSTQPLLGALYMELIKKESVGKRRYFGMILALGGVILVILKPTVRLHFSLDTLPGDLLTLVAGVCAAIFFSAWSKPLLEIYSPLRLMGYCMVIGSLVLWLATLFAPIHRLGSGWSEILGVSWICHSFCRSYRTYFLVCRDRPDRGHEGSGLSLFHTGMRRPLQFFIDGREDLHSTTSGRCADSVGRPSQPAYRVVPALEIERENGFQVCVSHGISFRGIRGRKRY
jgi:drug/metabolite transporter (DMT)-like permease